MTTIMGVEAETIDHYAPGLPPCKQHLLAVGTQTGLVQIWDVAAEKKLRTMSGHSSRVGTVPPPPPPQGHAPDDFAPPPPPSL